MYSGHPVSFLISLHPQSSTAANRAARWQTPQLSNLQGEEPSLPGIFSVRADEITLNKRPLCYLVGNAALILLKAQTGEKLLQLSHNAEENQKITPRQENIKNINISFWDFPESLFPSPLLSTVAGGGGWRIQDLNKSQPSSRGPTNDSYSCPLNPPPGPIACQLLVCQWLCSDCSSDRPNSGNSFVLPK